MAESDCIFCRIVAGELPAYPVWSDDNYMAFLTPFPNTPGFSVVIPKEHHGSYIFEAKDDVMHGIMEASKKVAKQIEENLGDVGRCGIMFEGFGVDHLHAKLFPMHGTANMDEWQEIKSKIDAFFEQYPGYISSHDGPAADKEELKSIAAKIRGEA